MDIKDAFLNGELEEIIYMVQPKDGCQKCIFEWRVGGSHIHGVAQRLRRQGT